MNGVEVVQAFAERISAQDVDGLCKLMTEDHSFVDGLGQKVSGREIMRDGWKQYYSMVPDYWIKIERIFEDENSFGMFGTAGGTYTSDGTLKPENKWEVPAAWYAVIRDDLVAEWRVYADNDPIRQIIAREKGRSGEALS